MASTWGSSARFSSIHVQTIVGSRSLPSQPHFTPVTPTPKPPVSVELHLLQQGQVVHVEPLAGRALFVGRNPDNDLVLAEGTVSGRHALFHLTGQGRHLMLRDLGSTNGTFLRGQRVAKPVELSHGDRVRLGSTVELMLHIQPSAVAPPPAVAPSLLVDLHTGVAHPIRSDRIFVGAEPHCQVQVPGAATACITLHDRGEIWLSTEDNDTSIEPGSPFEVAGRELVFRAPSSALSATVRETVERDSYSFELSVCLQAETGPEAWITNPASSARHCVTAENRVSLLWVLGSRLLKDRAEGTPLDTAGWCQDEDVMRGIWGRAWDQMGSNNYQVLLSRTRREFAMAGFDGWFIEKRRGYTRLRLENIQLLG